MQRCYALFWILGVLEVACITDDRGRIHCNLRTIGGREIDCDRGPDQALATENQDLKPEMAARCLTVWKRW